MYSANRSSKLFISGFETSAMAPRARAPSFAKDSAVPAPASTSGASTAPGVDGVPGAAATRSDPRAGVPRRRGGGGGGGGPPRGVGTPRAPDTGLGADRRPPVRDRERFGRDRVNPDGFEFRGRPIDRPLGCRR